MSPFSLHPGTCIPRLRTGRRGGAPYTSSPLEFSPLKTCITEMKPSHQPFHFQTTDLQTTPQIGLVACWLHKFIGMANRYSVDCLSISDQNFRSKQTPRPMWLPGNARHRQRLARPIGFASTTSE